MSEAADHEFHRKLASPALVRAMEDLAQRTGRSLDECEGMRLGEAYGLAVDAYGATLPEFWRVWNEWNVDDDAAPMGDL